MVHVFNISLKFLVYLAKLIWINLKVTAHIDKVFKLLSAPIADSIKVKNADTTMEKIGRRVSSTARRVSIIASYTASAFAKQIGAQRFRKLIYETSTIIIPESTKADHQVVRASMTLVVSISQKKLQQCKFDQLYLKAAIQKNVITDNKEKVSDNCCLQ